MNDFERFRSAKHDYAVGLRRAGPRHRRRPARDHRPLFANAGVRRLVLDMSQVTCCDCSGLGALMEAREAALRKGTCFELTEVQAPVVMRLLTLTGTDALFGLNPSA
ncbi:STAS domain-containing protein [Streptomyces bungoensis]|uniref:STAS domain-containing protein n=1 Tax=Streptomyces bungoensis TaxID=285568 RepID=UPI00342CC0FF